MEGKEADRRHCMVVHATYPLGETRVQRQALALADRGWDVDVICLRGDGEPPIEVVEGVRVIRMPVRRRRGSGMAAQLMEYLAFFVLAAARLSLRHLRRRYDSVQVHNLPDFLVFAAVLPKLLGAKVLLDLHDLMPEFFASRTGRPLDDRLVGLVRLQERLSCSFADAVLTVTDLWRQTLVERGVPPEKVAVVMNTADPRFFGRATRVGDSAHFTLVYHGTFTQRYGVDLLLAAMPRLREAISGIRLSLLGDGEARKDLLEQRSRLGLEDVVEISPGMLGPAELIPRLLEADLGVVPNRSNVFTDGILPTKLLEYVALGLPVLASRTPGVEAHFDDTMIAFFRPGDVDDLVRQVEELHRHRDRLTGLAARAQEFDAERGWELGAREYVGLIERLSPPTSLSVVTDSA